jgi:hypothetical protein
MKPTKSVAVLPAVVPSTTLDPADILTVAELASRLKVRETWVYETLRTRKKSNSLPYFKVGKYLRFSWRAVCLWLNANGSKAAA